MSGPTGRTLLYLSIATTMMLAGAVVATAHGRAVGPAATTFPRAQTLYTEGTQSGPIAGFNPYGSTYATGTVGLAYETLFRYDPLANKYIPWLATRGDWSAAKTFKISVRPGVKWSDGSAFDSSQVKWNLDLGRFAGVSWHSLWNGIAAITVNSNVVTIRFKGVPQYQQFQNQLWNIPMVEQKQWQPHANQNEILTWSPPAPVGTGPYVFDAAGSDPKTQVAWTKNPTGWWAAKDGLEPDPKPQYIVDLVTGSAGPAATLLVNGQEDLNNSYLPGVARLIATNRGLVSYYSAAPYELSAATEWLLPNLTRTPLKDLSFRKALAASINLDQIVQDDYQGVVLKASPTGLLPVWAKWIDQNAVKQNGFTYDAHKAAQMLQSAGYKQGSDGYFRNKDGSALSLNLAVPNTSADLIQVAQTIAIDAKAVGIKIVPTSVDYATWLNARNTGAFDLVLDNSAAISDTPYTYYHYLYNLPIGATQTTYNFSRYSNAKAWALTQQLNRTSKNDTSATKKLTSDLEKITMQQLPAIPLYYSGIWAQASTQSWSQWPSTASLHYLPTMWRGYMQMTGIDMLAHLAPAGTGGA